MVHRADLITISAGDLRSGMVLDSGQVVARTEEVHADQKKDPTHIFIECEDDSYLTIAAGDSLQVVRAEVDDF